MPLLLIKHRIAMGWKSKVRPCVAGLVTEEQTWTTVGRTNHVMDLGTTNPLIEISYSWDSGQSGFLLTFSFFVLHYVGEN